MNKHGAHHNEFKMEVVVGAFVLMVFLGMVYFTIILSREAWWGKDRERIEIVFDNVMGLAKGDNVVVRGMPVGKVKDLLLMEDGVHVFVVLDEDLDLRRDYRITVVATSILGGRYLQIDEGSDAMMLPIGSNIRGTIPYDLMADAAEVVHSVRHALVEGGTISNVQSIVSAISDVASRVNEGRGTIGRLLSEDDTLYKDIASTVASMKSIAARIENGEGTLGKLTSKDDPIYDQIVKTIDEVRATVDDYRETAPVVTFTSIFFGAF